MQMYKKIFTRIHFLHTNFIIFPLHIRLGCAGPTPVVVQYMYNTCTIFVQLVNVHILYKYCTYIVQRLELVLTGVGTGVGREVGRDKFFINLNAPIISVLTSINTLQNASRQKNIFPVREKLVILRPVKNERKTLARKDYDLEVVEKLADSLGVDKIIATLLVERGVTTFEEAKHFFHQV